MNILSISSFLEALKDKGIDNMLEKWYKKVALHYPLLPIASLEQIKMFLEFDMWIIPVNNWTIMVYNTVLLFSVYVL